MGKKFFGKTFEGGLRIGSLSGIITGFVFTLANMVNYPEMTFLHYSQPLLVGAVITGIMYFGVKNGY